VPVDLAAFLWLALIVLVSAFVQGMVGFAFGMIAMGFATLVLDARMASFLIAPLATVNIAIVLWSVRDRVRLAIVGPIMLGSLTGLPFGLVILLGGSAYVIRVLIALLLIYVGVTRLVRRTVTPRPLSLWWGTVAGLASGVIGGATNMGGPPLIAYAARQTWSPETFKATLLTIFFIGSFTKTIVLIWQGALNRPMLRLTAVLVPIICVGSAVGISLFNRIDGERFGRIVAVVLLVLGVWLLL